jgi:hypothetical protein
MDKPIIGNTVDVTFDLFNKSVSSKVDTGATTCSLHATDIQATGDKVSFKCPALSEQTITMDVSSSQQITSADGGSNVRPAVTMNITISNIAMQVLFNLNDRSNMDFPVLIGQNALQDGNFVIDVSVGGEEHADGATSNEQPLDNKLQEALVILRDNNINIHDVVSFAINAPAHVLGNPEEYTPIAEAVVTILTHKLPFADLITALDRPKLYLSK